MFETGSGSSAIGQRHAKAWGGSVDLSVLRDGRIAETDTIRKAWTP
jgi:hypothetical protein